MILLIPTRPRQKIKNNQLHTRINNLNIIIQKILQTFAPIMQILRNIYVDSFRTKKPNSTYFLTHWHSDHYSGITTNWSYGPIYCSIITRKILLTKYPKLGQIVYGLQLCQPYTLTNNEGTQYTVRLYDSNHIAGSVMILFELPNKKYTLHTGDMRFNTHCLQNTPDLFTYNHQTNTYKCNYNIDTLYLDNTYCDPIFMFPNRSDAMKMVKDIIDGFGPGSRMVYLVTDTIGKEEAFVAVSLCYGVVVTLGEQRMEYVKQMYGQELRSKIFCTKQQAHKQGSWIEVIKRKQVEPLLKQDPRAIAIKLTGWANLQASHPLSQHQYIVPYSLHSNYQQLQLFMSVVRPKQLFPVVRDHDHKSSKFRQNIHSYGSYFGSLMHMKQRGFAFFATNYLSTPIYKQQLKQQYKIKSNNPINHKPTKNQSKQSQIQPTPHQQIQQLKQQDIQYCSSQSSED